MILVRDRVDGQAEVFLVRRHRNSGFMPSTFVFPGGKLDPADTSHEETAARELFEEAGVLLSPSCPPNLADWRRRVLDGQVAFQDLLCTGVVLDTRCLHFWSRWITPSLEPRRFDARFFLAVLPAGQEPSFDARETVDSVWVTPGEALARQGAGQLPVPPPQLRMLTEMAEHPSTADLLEAAAGRPRRCDPILPRVASVPGRLILLLPWDPEYLSLGLGEALPLEHGDGPSRFVWEGSAWRLSCPSGNAP